jgi:anti-anti-sigma regulatory factor
MRQQISFLTQSRFYSPAFNSAIYDGPVRIYFAQYQESLALKVYFNSQLQLKKIKDDVRDLFRTTGINIFVMLYPSEEAFDLSFGKQEIEAQNFDSSNEIQIAEERLGQDFVLGIRGTITDEMAEKVSEKILEILNRANELAANIVLNPVAAQISDSSFLNDSDVINDSDFIIDTPEIGM